MRSEPDAIGPISPALSDPAQDLPSAVTGDAELSLSTSPVPREDAVDAAAAPSADEVSESAPAASDYGTEVTEASTTALDATPVTDVELEAPPEPATPPPAVLPVVDVDWLDWDAIRRAVNPRPIRARMRDTVERLEALLDRDGGPGLLFDEHRASPDDRAIAVPSFDDTPTWFIGDLHGDLLALETAIALARPDGDASPRARLVFLGDLIDDGGFGLEVLLRVFELIVDDPSTVCIIAGNHDEALGYDGARFTATVSPSDFSTTLNANLAHEWISRAGKLAVRLFAAAPRALFFPDGLLVAHGGFPLTDLHAELAVNGDWNDPRCLSDFVWTRAHPKARRKMPNRTTRGSQFGHEDFAAFCDVATSLGRPVTHMVRGHDHVEDRWAIYPAYASHPLLTTVALSRQLARESFGPYERVPTIARWVRAAVPEVHRLHIPGALVREIFPPETEAEVGAE